MECVRLRVKDVDFPYHQITVRDGKGAQDRVTMLPRSLAEPLQRHLARVKLVHEKDLLGGYGEVYLPYAFDRKDPMPAPPGSGSMSFPLPNAPSIRVLVLSADTMCQKRYCKEPCNRFADAYAHETALRSRCEQVYACHYWDMYERHRHSGHGSTMLCTGCCLGA